MEPSSDLWQGGVKTKMENEVVQGEEAWNRARESVHHTLTLVVEDKLARNPSERLQNFETTWEASNWN